MPDTSTRALRKFGYTLGTAFGLIGALSLWRGKAAWPYVLGVSAFFLLCAVIAPRLLGPIEWAWMKLAHYMGLVMTRVLLTLTFFVMITPMGLLMRLFGKDPLALKLDRGAKSYWVPVEVDGPGTRPDKPY